MTKALILCTETDRIWGGRGEHVQQVAKRLHANGVTPYLITIDNKWLETPPCYTRSIHEIPNAFIPRTNEESRLSNQMAWIELGAKVIREQGCNVIQAHDWDAVTPALALRGIFNIPVVISFHLFQYQLVMEMGQEETEDTRVSMMEEVRGHSEANLVTYCSVSMQQFALRQLLPAQDSLVLYNGVDVQEWITPMSRSLNSRKIVLYCGRLCSQKGYDIFLDLVEQDIAGRFEWQVMGQVPALEQEDAEKTVPMRRVRKLESEGKLKYLGHLYGEEKRKKIRQADAIVVPSRKEPFGIIALEAFAAGVPLFTTRVDGLAEFCTDDNSYTMGELVPFLESGGIHFKQDAALQTARLFNWDKCAASTARFLKEVCNVKISSAKSSSECRCKPLVYHDGSGA